MRPPLRLGQIEGKKRFADQVLAASKAFALCCTLDAALEYRDELAFFQAINSALTKHGSQDMKRSDEAREHALWQIISGALVSDEVIDIFATAGLDRPDIGILTDEFLDDVKHMEYRNLAVELLSDATLKEIARQLTDYLRRNLSVDWSVRETVHAKMRAQIKLILKRHKYPPDLELRAAELVLRQAEALSEVWMV